MKILRVLFCALILVGLAACSAADPLPEALYVSDLYVNGVQVVPGGGTSDHGLLTGLGDDDHSQYSLVDGSRDFTGAVGGVTPVTSNDLTTREYVDTAVAGAIWEFFFDNVTGTGGYFNMGDPTGGAQSTFTTAGLGAGNGQALDEWITDAAVGFTTVNAGVVHVHLHAEKTAGTKPVTIYGELYEREAGGGETLITTTEVSSAITAATEITLHGIVSSNYAIDATSFLVIKLLANVGATGSDATVALYAEGTTSSRIGVSAPGTAGGGVTTFLGLTDTPDSYAGHAGKAVLVNGGETGLEFVAGGAGYTDEQAQDAVGAMIADTTTIDLTYTDATPELKADLVAEGVQDLVGAMAGGTESGINVTYNDGTGMIDYSVTITQYTDEMSQDATTSLIQNGTGITWSYNDVANTLTPTVTITQYTDELAQDAVGNVVGDTTTVTLSYDDPSGAISADLVTEGVEDLVGAMVDGTQTGITVTYNDGTGNLDFVVTAAGYTDEQAQDAVGTILGDTATIDFTYDDGGNAITAVAVTEGIEDLVGAMVDGTESGITVTYNDATGNIDFTVPGDGLGSDGDKGDITVGGAGTTLQYDADSVTYADIQNVTDARLLGRSAGSSGDVQEITVGSGLSLSGGALTATSGSWTTSTVTGDVTVTNSAVLADATGINFTTVANTQYTIKVRVFFATTSASADFKYRITHAGTTTRVWRRILSGEGDNLPTFKAPANAFDAADRTLLDTAAATFNIIEEYIVVQVGVTGGVLKMQFAQNTATPGQTATVFEGSYIEYAAT